MHNAIYDGIKKSSQQALTLSSIIPFNKLNADVLSIKELVWSKNLLTHDKMGPCSILPLREYKWPDHSMMMQDAFSRSSDFADSELLTRLPAIQFYLNGFDYPVYKASLIRVHAGSSFVRPAHQSFVSKPSRVGVFMPITMDPMVKCCIDDDRLSTTPGDLYTVGKNAFFSIKNLSYEMAMFLFFDIDIPDVI